jgi:hypothetical protein
MLGAAKGQFFLKRTFSVPFSFFQEKFSRLDLSRRRGRQRKDFCGL